MEMGKIFCFLFLLLKFKDFDGVCILVALGVCVCDSSIKDCVSSALPESKTARISSDVCNAYFIFFLFLFIFSFSFSFSFSFYFFSFFFSSVCGFKLDGFGA